MTHYWQLRRLLFDTISHFRKDRFSIHRRYSSKHCRYVLDALNQKSRASSEPHMEVTSNAVLLRSRRTQKQPKTENVIDSSSEERNLQAEVDLSLSIAYWTDPAVPQPRHSIQKRQ